MSSRRELARTLEQVVDFDTPQIRREQYLTPPELAATIVHHADLLGDLARLVVDLGTGTGMLAIAAKLRTHRPVIGIDIDGEALELAGVNARSLSVSIEWVLGDIRRLPLCPAEPTTVLMNPPFGAQHESEVRDRAFLRICATIATVSYSIHNVGSYEFIEAFVHDYGGTIDQAFRAPMSLPRQFSFHTREDVEIPAEVYRIEWDPSD